MRNFDKLIIIFVIIAGAAFAAVNVLFIVQDRETTRFHNVEVNRVIREITDTGTIPDTGGYKTILGIYEGSGSGFYVSDNDCVIREVNGRLYRIEYAESRDMSAYLLYMNIILGVFCAAVIGLLIYVRQAIIKPFAGIKELPAELAKGSLTAPLKESRSRYFGKFIWGLDMLRESTEKSRQAELALQKEKKTMLMSLSHDIKTPLSAIKLYSAALSKGIYTDPDKQREAAESINAKADEIEALVSEIMRSGSEDIMSFDVKNGEFYLSQVISGVERYYLDRLTADVFGVGSYSDCLIGGDPDRLTEVLRNIIENAIKYGDGRRIELSFSDEEGCRLITVVNSGCGLPQEELAHIFDSFWRGSNSGSREGSGLGLYICRRLMNAMNGDIFAEIKDGDMRVTVVCRKK